LALASLYPVYEAVYLFAPISVGCCVFVGNSYGFCGTKSKPLMCCVGCLYAANLIWTVAYDTQYAMADREDDLKIGVKSTAILFGRFDLIIISLLQGLFILLLALIGYLQHFGLSMGNYFGHLWRFIHVAV
jgi:4-hydroxybenzoate polyprenyltransferase